MTEIVAYFLFQRSQKTHLLLNNIIPMSLIPVLKTARSRRKKWYSQKQGETRKRRNPHLCTEQTNRYSPSCSGQKTCSCLRCWIDSELRLRVEVLKRVGVRLLRTTSVFLMAPCTESLLLRGRGRQAPIDLSGSGQDPFKRGRARLVSAGGQAVPHTAIPAHWGGSLYTQEVLQVSLSKAQWIF